MNANWQIYTVNAIIIVIYYASKYDSCQKIQVLNT